MRQQATEIPWWRFWRSEEEKNVEKYNRGYEWSAGRLLSEKNLHLDTFELEMESYWYPDSYDDFDRGAEQALADFKEVCFGQCRTCRYLAAMKVLQEDDAPPEPEPDFIRTIRFPPELKGEENA